MRKNITFFLLFFFVNFILNRSDAWANDPERIVLKLQWLDQFQFAGYYMAKEKGFYAAAGLTVDIIPYTVGSQSVVENVVTNEAQYGTGRSSLIADRVNGKPVVLLAAIFQDTPSILLTLADRGIETPSDLVGRKIMINSDGLVEAGIMGMLWAENVRIHDVIHQRQSYNINDLINGVTDAMHCYISNEPYILQQRKIGFHVFLPKDFGQNYYGDLLFTSKREARYHPDRVKAFRDASLKGWAYAFDHIEETARVIKQFYNGQDKSFESLVFEGQELKKLAYKNDLVLGHVSKDKINDIADLYFKMGMIEKKTKLTDFVFE